MYKILVFLLSLMCQVTFAQHNQTTIKDIFPNGVGLVDLGLRVKWANCNVGASSPEESGTYFPYNDIFRYSSIDSFRLPTREEVEELLDKCSWQESKIHGVKGYKIIGPNGNSIFMPVSGLDANGNHIGGKTKIKRNGKEGWYWINQRLDFAMHELLRIQYGGSKYVFPDWNPFDVNGAPIRYVSK